MTTQANNITQELTLDTEVLVDRIEIPSDNPKFNTIAVHSYPEHVAIVDTVDIMSIIVSVDQAKAIADALDAWLALQIDTIVKTSKE